MLTGDAQKKGIEGTTWRMSLRMVQTRMRCTEHLMIPPKSLEIWLSRLMIRNTQGIPSGQVDRDVQGCYTGRHSRL
jgi:hypothetical protein